MGSNVTRFRLPRFPSRRVLSPGSKSLRSALAIGAHAAAPRSATSAVKRSGNRRVRHKAGAYDGIWRGRQDSTAQKQLDCCRRPSLGAS